MTAAKKGKRYTQDNLVRWFLLSSANPADYPPTGEITLPKRHEYCGKCSRCVDNTTPVRRAWRPSPNAVDAAIEVWRVNDKYGSWSAMRKALIAAYKTDHK